MTAQVDVERRADLTEQVQQQLPEMHVADAEKSNACQQDVRVQH